MAANTQRSLTTRLILTAIILTALLISAWIFFGPGQDLVTSIFGQPDISSPLSMRMLIFCLEVIYFLRLMITFYVLLKREMPWEEVYAVGPFVLFIMIFFTILTIYHKNVFRPVDWIWLTLFATGSCLNTCSEWQRMKWKEKKENKGKLYTGGLFRYSIHINYFGDSVSFAGFGLLTGSIWGLTVSLVMTLGFIFYHIPKLDEHLQEHYKDQFTEYSKKTKKFIPWIY